MNLTQIREDLIYNINHKRSTMMIGAAGVGKSQMAYAAASELNLPLVDIRASQYDSVDFTGLPVPDMVNDRTRWLTPDILPDTKRDGPIGVLFLDELTNAPMNVQGVLYQLILDRRIGKYVLPEGWSIVAAGNRASDKGAAGRIALPLANRMDMIPVEVDVPAWLAWAKVKGIHNALVAYVAWRNEALCQPPENMDCPSFATPRSVAECSAVLNDTLSDSQTRRLIGYKCGEAWSGEFMAFLATWRNLDPVPFILANPASARVPAEPSLQYAVAVALALAVTDQTFANALVYAGRLPPDYRALLVHNAVTREPTLMETQAYVDHYVSRTGGV